MENQTVGSLSAAKCQPATNYVVKSITKTAYDDVFIVEAYDASDLSDGIDYPVKNRTTLTAIARHLGLSCRLAMARS